MSRNSGGTYSLPAGQPVVTGTTIASTTFNNLTSDLATELTNSLDRQGRGAMLAKLQLYDGSVGAPGLTFGSDTDTGVYRAGANDMRLAANGADVLKVSTTGINVTGTIVSSGALTVTTGGLTVSAGTTALGATNITGTTVLSGATSTSGVDFSVDSTKDYKYTSTKSHILHVMGGEFKTSGAYPSYGIGTPNVAPSTNGITSFVAPLQLPAGAIITAIDVNLQNSDVGSKNFTVIAWKATKSSTNYNASTYFNSGGGGGNSVSVGAGTTNWFSVTLTGGVASIDDGADGYNAININTPATTSAGQAIIHGVRITYTMTTVKPAL